MQTADHPLLKNIAFTFTGLMATGLLSVVLTSPVLAQAGEDSASAGVLEEIFVTAQKRSQSMQEIPISIQAFTGDQMDDLRINRARDITKLAPNLNLSTQNTASQQINIRGVGTSDFFGNSTGSVGVYMDEVTMSSSYLSSLGLYDMERVEILRGPQNSLFGRNTTGGAVNYISRKPEVGGANEGFVTATLGNFDLIEVEVAFSIQLSESAALRIASKSYDRGGIWNNLASPGDDDHGDKDRKSIRATLVWEPSEETSVTFNFHYADEDSDFDPIRAVGTRLTNGSPNFGVVGPFPTFGGPPATPNLDFGQSYDTFNAQGNNPSTSQWSDVYVTGTYLHQVDTNGLYLKIEHELDFANFTSISAWDESDVLWTYDTGGIGNFSGTGVSNCTTCIYPFGGGADGSPQVTLAIDQDQKYEQISQEFRLVSKGGGPLRWIAGFNYFSEDSDLMQNVRFGLAAFDLSQPAPIGPFPGQPIGGFFGGFPLIGSPYSNQLAYHYAELENEVWSPYGQIEYDFADDFTFTLGARFTNDEKTVPFNQVGNITTLGDSILTVYDTEFVLARAAQGTLACDLDGDGNDTLSGINSPGTPDNRGRICNQNLNRAKLSTEEWGGKIGVAWRINENMLAYASFSRGFRSGKHDIEFLHGPQTGFAITDLFPETLDAFEVGLKMDLLDGAMQLNLGAYTYEWSNQQTIFVSPINGPTFVNIPTSDLMGMEAELKWVPAEGWFISAGLGLQDTKITKTSGTGFDQEGHELPFAAPESVNLLVTKELDVGQGVLTLQGDYQYRSSPKAYARDINYIDELEATKRLNARVSYLFGEAQAYELSLWGENLTENESCHYKWDLTGISGTTYCVAKEAEAFYGFTFRIKF